MCFAQTNFPGETGVLNGGQGRRAGTTVVPTDGNDVRACFGNARSDDADSGTGYELNANARTGIDGAKVVDQLREVFDAVNVVAWRMRAMYSLTFFAGNWPPSPGLEPCAILISSSSAWTR